MPMLKTSYISRRAPGVALDQRKDRMRLDQSIDHEADWRIDARQVQKTVAGDVDQGLHALQAAQDVHRLGNIDGGRTQQLLAEAAGELVEPMIDAIAVAFEKCAPRQRQAVAVNAVAAHPDHDIARPHVLAADDLVEIDPADGHADEVETAHDILELRGLATGDRHARHAGAFAQPLRHVVEHRRIGVIDGNVIHQETGLAPTQIMSFTFIATQSMPMVSNLPIIVAIIVLVPTPSVQIAMPFPSNSMTLAK